MVVSIHRMCSLRMSASEECHSQRPCLAHSLFPALSCREQTSWDWNEKLQTEHGVDRLRHWKKGNQRNTLIRKHAKLAVTDTKMVSAFVHDCMYCIVSRLLRTLMQILPPAALGSLKRVLSAPAKLQFLAVQAVAETVEKVCLRWWLVKVQQASGIGVRCIWHQTPCHSLQRSTAASHAGRGALLSQPPGRERVTG